jgi:hypothetical protein
MLRRPLALALLALPLAVSAAPSAAPAVTAQEVGAAVARIGPHPRLFLDRAAETALKARIAQDPLLQALQARVLADADRELKSQPVARVLIGRRLLDKSRTALARTLTLGLAWRLTGKPAYFARAQAELLAVAAFPDWNPSHFLDVAEMTAAVAIGYDWLYPQFDDATRAILRHAMLGKGLKASLKSNSWTRVVNNWNQVCNGGITLGALALAESEPALAAELVARAINTVPRAMHEYAPDGAYPEGPGYWSYGTTYNIFLIAALESALGRDFGLTQQPGFLASADYYLHVIGPSGLYFNYADCGRGGDAVSPAMFWFARRRGETHLLWHEYAKLEAELKPGARPTRSGRGYNDALVLLWLPANPRPAAPAALSWTGRGPNPVAFHRSDWTRAASFVAVKGGSPSVNHAHMDVGAFVMDADGVRWADDLGMQDYNSLESKGIKLWDKTQDSERWRVFRLGASAHNVLQVDGRQQRVDGDAKLVVTQPGRTVVDLGSIYATQLAVARRGVALQADRTVRVQDEFTAAQGAKQIRWAMVTRADVAPAEGGRAILTESGKTLTLRVLEPAGASLRVYPTDPPPAATDAPNPGTRLVGFEVALTPGQPQRIVVQLEPASATPAALAVTALAQW